MSIQITVTEEEILSTPNYYDMGKKVHDRFWQARRDKEGPQSGDEHFSLTIDEEGIVQSINSNELERCTICGKETPYPKSMHIDFRDGYVEGAGQGCFQPNQCNK